MGSKPKSERSVAFVLEDAPSELRHAVVGIPVRFVELGALLPAVPKLAGADGADYFVDDEPPTLRVPRQPVRALEPLGEAPFPLSRISSPAAPRNTGATFPAILLGFALTLVAFLASAPRRSSPEPLVPGLDVVELSAALPPDPPAIHENAPPPETVPASAPIVLDDRPFSRPAALAALDLGARRASSCDRADGGAARVAVTFAPNGRVAQVVETGDFVGTATAGCIERAFRRVEIPPFDGGPITIVRKLTLAD